MSDGRHLRRRLAHVLWIGGPPDCGKTSIADLVAQHYGMQVYHFDRHEVAHFGRANPQKHPALYRAHPDRMTTEERWLGSSPRVMANETIACWSERCAMAIDDILEMSASSAIVAEGPGFFPQRLMDLIPDPSRAIWLIPSLEFKITSATGRNKPGNRWETSDPERAQRNLIERDLLMGEHIRREAQKLNLPIYEVDGSKDLSEVLADVEAYFEPHLRRLVS